MALADHSSRKKALDNGITVRQRRHWLNVLLNGVDKVEAAYADLDKDINKAHEAGMSWAAIAGVLGMHPTSIKEISERASAGGEGGS